MKKLLCILLALSLVLSCSLVFASDVEETTELSEAVTLFTSMGFEPDSDNLQKEISRAEFAVYIAEFLGIDVYAYDERNFFADIDDDFWAKTAINTLVDRKYISGYNGGFNPGAAMADIDALKVMLELAGYGAEAIARGGYPNGYLMTATRLKILDGISIDSCLTEAEYWTLLYRICNLDYMEIKSIEGDNVVYGESTDETVLGFHHNIYYICDQLTAVGSVGMYGRTSYSDDVLSIGDKLYKNPYDTVDFYLYLGQEIEVYYYEDADGKRTLVCLLDAETGNNTLTIYDSDFSRVVDNGKIYTVEYYDENGRSKSARIDRGASVIRNGQAVTTDVENALKISHGYIHAVDCDGNRVYDTVRVYDGYDMHIGQINNEATDVINKLRNDDVLYIMRGEVGNTVIFYDMHNPSLAVDLTYEDGRVIRLKSSDGNLINYDDFNTGDVVTVFKSENGNIVEVVKGLGAVRGTADSISQNGRELTIGDTVYNVTKDCAEQYAEELVPGCNASFKLNFFGEIAGIEFYAEGDKKLGYLFEMSYREKGLSNYLDVKIFTQDDEVKIFEVSDRIKLDNKVYDDFAQVASKLSNKKGELVRTLVRYGTDSEGKLNFLDLAASSDALGEDTEDSLIYTGSGSGYYYYTSKQITDFATSLYDANTLCFVIPTDAAFNNDTYVDEWFAIKKVSGFDTGSTQYTLDSYRVGLHSDYDDAVIIKKDNTWTRSTSTPTILIRQIKEGVDSEGEPIHIISGYTTGQNPVTYYTRDTSALRGANLKAGDYAWFGIDIDGKITALNEIFYRADSGKTFSGAIRGHSGGTVYDKVTESSVFSALCLHDCYATEVVGDVLRVGYEKGEFDGAFVIPTSIYVIENIRGKTNVRYGGKSEIVDYIRAGEDCTRLLIYSSTHQANTILIYK